MFTYWMNRLLWHLVGVARRWKLAEMSQIWPKSARIWANQTWSKEVSVKRSCKMYLRHLDLGSIGLPSQNLPQARCWCYVATSVRPCPFSLVHQGLATTTVSHFLDQDLFSMQASVAFSVRLLGSLVLLVCWCVWGCDWWRWVVSVVHNNNGAAPVRNAYVISVYILPSVCLI